MLEFLPATAKLEEYENQAAALLQGQSRGEPELLDLIHHNHPRFLDREVVWMPLRLGPEDIRAAAFDLDDARLTLARWYNFRDWAALAEMANAMKTPTAGVYEFELAVEAVVAGNAGELKRLLRNNPGLAQARSSRVTHFDPPAHQATLLHYLAANGVENYRQKSPPNAVEIARILLDARADPNALAAMYGGRCTTLSMLVSSSPPAAAGVQIPLVEVLLDYGATPDERGEGKWVSHILTALVFGFTGAAETLARRGARVDRLSVAAGLGRMEEAKAMLAEADSGERHRALAVAALAGRAAAVGLLLDAGENPDAYNPDGMHGHATPLHQAALAGHEAVVRLLVERGARLDIQDKLWKSTPRGWAEHAGRKEIADYLRNREMASS